MNANNLCAILRHTGGFTIHTVYGDSPQAGDKKYAVAFSKSTERTYPLDTFSPSDLVAYITDNAVALGHPWIYLGAWVDCDTVYLDCSKIITDRADAFEMARENDQLAIFSFETMESLATPDFAIAA